MFDLHALLLKKKQAIYQFRINFEFYRYTEKI